MRGVLPEAIVPQQPQLGVVTSLSVDKPGSNQTHGSYAHTNIQTSLLPCVPTHVFNGRIHQALQTPIYFVIDRCVVCSSPHILVMYQSTSRMRESAQC